MSVQRFFVRGVVVAAAVAATPGVGRAAPIGVGDFGAAPLINFDNLTGGSSLTTGDVITTQYAGQGIVFFNPDYPVRANTSLAALVGSNSDPNVAYVQQHDGTNGRPLQLQFSTPVNAVGTQYYISSSRTITLTAYSSAGLVIESLTLTGTPDAIGLEGFIGLQETTPIAYAELSSALASTTQPQNFTIDDVRFRPVPEPTALAAFGTAAIVLCRRRGR